MSFVHTLTVRWRDCDMYQHVNNAVYITYFEEARAAFWRDLMAERFGGFDFIIAEVTCTYLSPARLAEALAIAVEVVAVGNKSFQLAYEITERTGGRVIARGKSAQVMYDHERQVSHGLPDHVRERLEAVRIGHRPA